MRDGTRRRCPLVCVRSGAPSSSSSAAHRGSRRLLLSSTLEGFTSQCTFKRKGGKRWLRNGHGHAAGYEDGGSCTCMTCALFPAARSSRNPRSLSRPPASASAGGAAPVRSPAASRTRPGGRGEGFGQVSRTARHDRRSRMHRGGKPAKKERKKEKKGRPTPVARRALGGPLQARATEGASPRGEARGGVGSAHSALRPKVPGRPACSGGADLVVRLLHGVQPQGGHAEGAAGERVLRRRVECGEVARGGAGRAGG